MRGASEVDLGEGLGDAGSDGSEAAHPGDSGFPHPGHPVLRHLPAAGAPAGLAGHGGPSGGDRPSPRARRAGRHRSEEHTSELQSLMRISYAVFCLKKKMNTYNRVTYIERAD